MDATTLSLIFLWCLVLTLGVCVLALARQVGILYERVAPMGALMLDHGPKVGELAPSLEVRTWEGQPMVLGAGMTQSTLLFFISPTCPVCKKLLPIMRTVRQRESSWLRVVLASDGERPEHDALRQEHQLTDFDYVLSQPLGMTYKISKLPYCVLLDASGQVRAKGLVNSREQIESLLTAHEMRVASVQAHLEHAGSSGAGSAAATPVAVAQHV